MSYLATFKLSYSAGKGSGAPASQSYSTTVISGSLSHGFTVSSTKPTPPTGYYFVSWGGYKGGANVTMTATASSPSQSKTLTAVYAIKTYTVTYNANGGSGAPESQTKKYGTALTLSSDTPTEEGYTFLYWNTAADATGTTYYPGGTYTANSAVTLYAIYSRITYTAHYDANGGPDAPADQYKYYGSTVSLSTEIPTREGYDYKYWNTASDGSGDNVQPGAEWSSNQDLTLYAVWSLQTHTVSYNANGGNYAPASQTKYWGISLTLNSSVPSREGYAFTGWNTESNGTGSSYSPGQQYDLEADVTMYAMWALGRTISYDANGGTGTLPTQTKYDGTDITLSTETPTRAGYTFSHWNTSSNGTGTSYNPGDTYSGDAELRLYAIWVGNIYTISFDILTDTKNVTFGQKIGTLPYPSKTGYTFKNWMYGGYAVTQDTIMTTAADITLTATFSANVYTITFAPNGGTTSISSVAVTYDDYIPALPTPTRAGYDFGGWAVDGAAILEGQKVTFTEDKTATASWVSRTFTVTYVPGTGTGTAFTQTITFGTPWTTNSSNSFTKTGCHQTSWGSVEMGETMNTWSNMTLTALYSPNTYTLTLTGSGVKDVQYGSTLGTLPVPGKPGKIFLGWYVGESRITYETVYNWTENITATASYRNRKQKIALPFRIDESGKAHFVAIFRKLDGSCKRGLPFSVKEDS